MKKILNFIVVVILKYEFIHKRFEQNGKFKVGDVVVYNWMAKARIYSAIKDNLDPRTVSKVCWKDKSGLDFECGDHCSSFWVKKFKS